MNRKIVVVGAGLTGVVIAREFAEAGFEVMVYDSRNHIGGNCYDYLDTSKIRIHKYGPHIFHTKYPEVIDYVNRFSNWIPYKHKVLAQLDDFSFVPFPPNKTTIDILGEDNISKILYEPYSQKMWGKSIEDIKSMGILNRVKVKSDDNPYYFSDDFQALPSDGYTKFIENILLHENITVKLSYQVTLNSNVLDKFKDVDFIFWTGPVEGINHYDIKLEYRSIEFESHLIPIPRVYETAVVNFTHTKPYTRVTEWKNFPNNIKVTDKTLLTLEKPKPGSKLSDLMYPVRTKANLDLYEEYKSKYANTIPNLILCGRLGGYKYINMDEAIKLALDLTKTLI